MDIKRDVLDSAIPAVHLHKIVLETSASPLAELNPHIDDERETSINVAVVLWLGGFAKV